MHGPEHWFGLVWAWLIIGFVIYGLLTLFDEIRKGVVRIVRRIVESR